MAMLVPVHPSTLLKTETKSPRNRCASRPFVSWRLRDLLLKTVTRPMRNGTGGSRTMSPPPTRLAEQWPDDSAPLPPGNGCFQKNVRPRR
jgi:hypothetical protein